MTIFGPTPTGYRRKTFTEIKQSVADAYHGTISPSLDLDSAQSVAANLVLPILDEISQAHESAELAFNAFDPDSAVDFLMLALARLSGVEQLPARPGFADVTLTVDDAVSFAPGEVVLATTGNPSNTWENRDAIVFTSAGSQAGLRFRSQAVGSQAVAGASTLQIAQPLNHLSGATNPSDALPGRDIETIEEVRLRRDASLAAQGSATLAAVLADVVLRIPTAQVAGVDNPLPYYAGPLPPHSMRITVYDPSATNAEIAQAIWDSKSAGIQSVGNTTGAIVDSLGLVNSLTFQRAVEVEIYVRITGATGIFDAAAVKAAIIAAQPKGVGKRVIVNRLESAVFTVPGYEDHTAFEISTDGIAFGTGNYNTAGFEVALLDPSRITFA